MTLKKINIPKNTFANNERGNQNVGHKIILQTNFVLSGVLHDSYKLLDFVVILGKCKIRDSEVMKPYSVHG